MPTPESTTGPNSDSTSEPNPGPASGSIPEPTSASDPGTAAGANPAGSTPGSASASDPGSTAGPNPGSGPTRGKTSGSASSDLTPEEKKRIENERNFEIRNELLRRRQAEQERMKQEARQLQYEREDKGKAEDIRKEEYWKKVLESAERLLHEGIQGYNDWATSYLAILFSLSKLNRALFYDFPEFSWTKGLGRAISGKIKDLALPDRVRAPNIDVAVEFDENGKFDTVVTQNNEKIDDEMKKLFDVGFVAWAKLQGYRFDSGSLVNSEGETMTPEVFLALNQDDDNSLNKFLSGRFNLNVSASVYQGPSNTP